MKSIDAARAAILVEALNDLPGAVKDLKREKPKVTAHYRTIRFEFGDRGGYLKSPEWSYRLDLDAQTMRLVLAATEKIVRDELNWMGVEIVPPPAKKAPP